VDDSLQKNELVSPLSSSSVVVMAAAQEVDESMPPYSSGALLLGLWIWIWVGTGNGDGELLDGTLSIYHTILALVRFAVFRAIWRTVLSIARFPNASNFPPNIGLPVLRQRVVIHV